MEKVLIGSVILLGCWYVAKTNSITREAQYEAGCGQYVSSAATASTLALAKARLGVAQSKCKANGQSKELLANLAAIAKKKDLSQIKTDLKEKLE